MITNYPGWVADMLLNTQCRIAVSPDDPEAFALALEEMVDNPQRLVTMGKAATTLAKSTFNRDDLSNRFSK